jgi:hypothetical protein
MTDSGGLLGLLRSHRLGICLRSRKGKGRILGARSQEIAPAGIVRVAPVPDGADGDGVSGGALFDERGLVTGIPHGFRSVSNERNGKDAEGWELNGFPNVPS